MKTHVRSCISIILFCESHRSNVHYLLFQVSGESPTSNLKRVKTKEQIHGVLSMFVKNRRTIQGSFLTRLEEIRQKIEDSAFFMSHEVGSAVDENKSKSSSFYF